LPVESGTYKVFYKPEWRALAILRQAELLPDLHRL